MLNLNINCKKLITDTITSNIKRSTVSGINDIMEATSKKAIKFAKSKIGYSFYFSETEDIKNMTKLIKRFDPDKFKENCLYKKERNGFRSASTQETLTTTAKFNIKIPNCKAYMRIEKNYPDSLHVFIYGPDAKTVYKLLLVYMNKDLSSEPEAKPKAKTCKVYTIDVDIDGDFIIRGGNKSSSKTLNSIYTDNSNKEKISNYLSKWKQSSTLFKDLNISYKLGILLYGPPGTGKTSMAKAISTLLNYDIYTVNMNHFVASVIPDIKTYVEDRNGVIILLEDIDYIFGKREKEFTQEEKARSNALLQLLDGAESMPNVVFIATTNDLDSLDEAIIRDGRFDLKICMDNIDEPTAKEMCKGLYLTAEQTTELLKDEAYPINPAYLQNKIIQYIFSHIENMDFGKRSTVSSKRSEAECERSEWERSDEDAFSSFMSMWEN